MKITLADDLKSVSDKLRKKKADPAVSPSEGKPQQESQQWSRVRENRPLVTVPPPPPGTELTFAPMGNAGFGPLDPEAAVRQKTERARHLWDDLRTIGPIESLPAVGSSEFQKLRAEAFDIVRRRFGESRAVLESDTVSIYQSNVTWSPDFGAASRTVAATDRKRALDASYGVAYAVTHLDRPRFVAAFAAAIFALDPESVVGAGNAASAILASGERMHPKIHDKPSLQAFRRDAATVYRYVLALSVEAERWTLRSLGILVNLGNPHVDMDEAERARRATCRPELARAVLEDERLARPAIFAAAARSSKSLSDSHAAGELSPN